MSNKVEPSAQCHWLTLDRSGQHLVDFTCDNTIVRIQTRIDGGLDLHLVGKDAHSGAVTQLKCDLGSAISAMAEKLGGVDFKPEIYDNVSNMVRGEINPDSHGSFSYPLDSREISEKKKIANVEKWLKEFSYLEGLLGAFQILTWKCKGVIEKYPKRITRGMREVASHGELPDR